MLRRLIVCFDGTWNFKTDTTNIWRIYSLITDIDHDNIRQLKHYVRGVGSRQNDRILGGAVGAGTYHNVKDAYTWIVENYRPGDELSFFGFSRGALAALSLANLIDRCGILRPGSLNTFEEVYRLYQLPGFARNSTASQRFRGHSADSGLDSPLRLLGLFDTVVGLYASKIFKESMHVLALPSSVSHVFHAIAIDESRRLFPSLVFRSAPENGMLHERWFSGAHANVGGGYSFDPLATIPLMWMVGCAQKTAHISFHPLCGFDFENSLNTRERNSFHEFGYGIPALLFARQFRSYRSIKRKVSGKAEEWIDSSVVARHIKFATYRKTSIPLNYYFQDTHPTTVEDIYVRKQ
jgi:uncharacterized protein (DUF2235 family)